ncbi:MAG: PTS transporter subunit EIIC [Mycoplasma sp.]|nr:PTS transporter subunit EIIC [Mycoplasma sp.]
MAVANSVKKTTNVVEKKPKKVQANKPNTAWKRFFALLQRMGKSLLFPIAMLPFAAILLRLGAAIPTTTGFSEFVNNLFTAIANGVFGPALPFLFAIGISFGMSKDQRGEAAIVGFSLMVIITIMLSDSNGIFGGYDFVNRIYGGMTLNGGSGFHGLFGTGYNNILATNVFTGIFVGSIVSFLYNRFNGIELPSILGFFSGRRLVPVLAFISSLILGLLYALIFPWFGAGLYYIGKGLGEAQGNRWENAGVMLAYGIINRMLIPFGLHHVLNIPLWFTSIGGTHGGVSGDINIFLNAPALGNQAGTFQTGFFPIMMFGLPALVASIWFNAQGEKQKAQVASLFLGSALVSFFTGITEPIEFSFMFLAPALYGMHIILTGIVGFIVGVFGIQLGFGFSAGLIDYALSIPKSLDIIVANKTGFDAVLANPLWIWPIGFGTAAMYFFTGNFLIKKFNLNTPGRGTNKLSFDIGDSNTSKSKTGKTSAKAQKVVAALGGYENITMYSHCATRLRYDVEDPTKIDDKALVNAGAFGVAHPSKKHVHVVIGPTVEILHEKILAGKPETIKAKVVAGTVPS